MNDMLQRAVHEARTMLTRRTGERKAIERFLDLVAQGEEVDQIISALRLCYRDVRIGMLSAHSTPHQHQQEEEEEEAAADMYRVLLCKLGVRIQDWRGPLERAVLERECLTLYDYGLLEFAVSVCRQYQRPEGRSLLDALMNKLESLRALDYPQCEQHQEGGESTHGRDHD